MRKKKKERSSLQIAASEHAWNILQLRGAIAFLERIGLFSLASSVRIHGEAEIERRWKAAKEI